MWFCHSFQFSVTPKRPSLYLLTWGYCTQLGNPDTLGCADFTAETNESLRAKCFIVFLVLGLILADVFWFNDTEFLKLLPLEFVVSIIAVKLIFGSSATCRVCLNLRSFLKLLLVRMLWMSVCLNMLPLPFCISGRARGNSGLSQKLAECVWMFFLLP